jgi:RHS repeat-associated protein
MPFGEELNVGVGGRSATNKYSATTDNVRQKFTGYEKDDETGLDFAEARYYNNLHGRFTAVDPMLASGKSADPQTFNRYAYVSNNPTNSIDPTGMWQEDFGGFGTNFSLFDNNYIPISQPIPYQETTTTYSRNNGNNAVSSSAAITPRTGQQILADIQKANYERADAGDTTPGRTITLRNPNERIIQAGFSVTFKNQSSDNGIDGRALLGGVIKVVNRQFNAMLSLTILDTEGCSVDDCEVLKGFSYSVDGESGGKSQTGIIDLGTINVWRWNSGFGTDDPGEFGEPGKKYVEEFESTIELNYYGAKSLIKIQGEVNMLNGQGDFSFNKSIKVISMMPRKSVTVPK